MIGASPERDDFWRVRALAPGDAPFKEWQHFIIAAPGLDVLVNFNLVGTTARVIVLARANTWSGFVQTVDRFEISRDGCRSRFGSHRVTISEGRYHVVVDAPDHGIAVEATFTPTVLPITARRQRIAAGRHLDWSLVARLDVTGRVELPGVAVELVGALGYHDHNWGQFAWGDDFAWEWGHVLPRDGGDWAVVYSNLMNRARTSLELEQLFVWRGGANVLASGGVDVTSRMRGRYLRQPELRLPAPLALIRSRLDNDVPEVFEVVARNGHSEAWMTFTRESTSQVIVPSETSPCGTVTINECVGAVRLTLRSEGRVLDGDGWGVFEFVR